MSLDTSGWKPFILSDLFDIRKGKRLTSADQTDGDTLYIGAIDSNNGIANHIGQDAIHEGNTISLSYNGSVGEAFYQPQPFWATDDVNVLYFREKNNHEFNEYIGLFICGVLRQEKYRFSYGRKWTLENMKKTVIHLPVSDDGVPDWDFMESYMKTLHYKPLTTKNKKENIGPLNPADWREFRVGDLFECRNGKLYELSNDSSDSAVRYYTSAENNNGFAGYVSEYEEKDIINVPSLTVGSRGNDAITYYHDGKYIVNQNLTVLIPKQHISKAAMLFFAGVMRMEKYKYSYGRLMSKEKVRETILKLPATKEGLPDWKRMEDYIKSLPYGDRI